jgi:hypothetical protein
MNHTEKPGRLTVRQLMEWLKDADPDSEVIVGVDEAGVNEAGDEPYTDLGYVTGGDHGRDLPELGSGATYLWITLNTTEGEE